VTATATRRHRPTGTRRSAGRRGHRSAAGVVLAGTVLVLLPVVLLAGAGNPPCDTMGPGPSVATPRGRPEPGMFAAPLQLAPGHWYRVGATRYGGGAASSGAFLPSLPDSFAELSLLDHNPYPAFGFADANALGNLPYGTAIRVANGPRQLVLVKRDIGYGQGPGQSIPYRIDVYGSAAATLAITKTPVEIALAPASGTAATLDELPAPAAPGTSRPPTCATATSSLALTPGDEAQIQSDGSAAAPADAPTAVKLAVAAANQIHTHPYALGPAPVHYGALSSPWPAYDCSGAVSYVLYKSGLHSVWPDVSGTLEHWGQPGPGRWITVYANSRHTFIDIAGRAFDTANYGGPNLPAGSGPRWRQNPTGNLSDGLAYVARHPAAL
jgi:hypothetical protein